MKNIKTKWDYSYLAKNYDHRAEYDKTLIKKILKFINCKANYPVGDIGAGTGKLTKLLLKENLIVSAVEPNLQMRKFGIKNCNKFSKVSWTIATAENTKLIDNSLYSIFFGSSFNVVDYKKVFKEIKRVLIKNGFFCCLWNHRDLTDPLQKKIEKIINKYIKDYNYGDRRKNPIPIIKKSNLFKNIKFTEKKFYNKTSKKLFINAWKSHGTLKRQSNGNFNKIINDISIEVNRLKSNVIRVPFKTVAYYCQLKG